jgi:SAM-dependent methyltransferase
VTIGSVSMRSEVDETGATAGPGFQRGENTAYPRNVAYRVGRIAPYLSGRWLDYGCAEGGYAEALIAHGVREVVGVDVEEARIVQARQRDLTAATFLCVAGPVLPLADESMDGAFLNEVMEHVESEQSTLAEIRRVLRPGATLVVMSPNRWFPFEGHSVHVGSRHWHHPTPGVPWLPKRVTDHITEARNYWPRQLATTVADAGFSLVETGFVWPVFERFPWLPSSVIRLYQDHVEKIDDVPVLKRFGVSNLIVAKKP